MGQYLPIVILLILAVVFGILSFAASRPVGAPPAVDRQRGTVRVRDRAEPGTP